jgi:hypothetical protein
MRIIIALILMLLAIGKTAIAVEPIPPDSDKAKFAQLYALILTGTIEGSGVQESLSMHGVDAVVAQRLKDYITVAIADINALAAANRAAVCKAEDVETLATLLDALDAGTDARMERAVHELPQVFGPEEAARILGAAAEVHMSGATGHASEGIRNGSVSFEEFMSRAGCGRQQAHAPRS